MMNTAELWNEFRERRSEEAFAELVRRFSPLVFSVAKRRLDSTALVEEVAQSVFMRLAKSTPNISSEPELIGWLHRTSVHVAVDLWRAETRRRAREEKLAAMQSSMESNDGPSPLAEVVDEALDELSDRDRQTLLLRFFDGQKMREVAGSLGITEDAAKMRVGRSLDRLRERLALRGIQTTSVLLGAFLGEEASFGIPPGSTETILRAVGSIKGGTSGLASLSAISKWKLAGVLAGIGLGVILVTTHRVRNPSQSMDLNQMATVGTNRPNKLAKNPAASEPAPNEAEATANPMRLLQNVARARSGIVSGKIDYEQSVELKENSAHGAAETNTVLGQIIFEGVHRRIEETGYEYRYTGIGDAGERQAELMKKNKIHRADAVREGLLEQFEAHRVSTFDGSVVMEYSETDRRPFQTAIREPNTGGVGHFDPRCLGLRAFGSTTLEGALSLGCANEASLVGREDVEGTSAWHVRVKCHDTERNYWISVTEPQRLLKHAELGEVVISRYAPNQSRDPLPVEVILEDRNLVKRFRRRATECNVPVDPAIFTLVGLGMPPGTDVVDYRANRSLGYWNGQGLSETLHPQTQVSRSSDENAPSLLQQLAFVDTEPNSPRGLEAAIWIMLNTPDGPEVEKAGRAILDHHLQSTNVLTLATRLETLRPRCAKEVLNEMLSKNPDAAIRGTACLSLARTFLDEAQYGSNQKATAEAKKYFQRFLREFAASGKSAFARKSESAKALNEIDRGFLGHQAPDFTAMTTTGETFSLSETRGRVTLLLFRSSNSKYEAEEYRKVFEKVADREVNFITIFCDNPRKTAKLEDAVESSFPGWLVIRDGLPIKDAFYIHSWPSVVMIDKRGAIRHRSLRGPELEKAILATLSD